MTGPYRNVLVPLDRSADSAVALRSGHALAARFGATLHTIGVAGDAGEQAHLATVAGTALGVAPEDARVHTVVGDDVAGAIATLADELGDCLVCMASHVHGRLAGALLGSTARELLHRRERPVVLVGPLADRPAFMEESWPTPLAVGRLVVCVDAEPDGAAPTVASTTVEVAARWAAALASSLTILHVVIPGVSLTGEARGGEQAPWLVRLAEQAQRHVADVDARVENDPIGVGDGVRAHLAAHPAGLLAVSTQARSGVDRIVHGAIAAGIVAASSIATLVIATRGTDATT
jgi:nucleotide-binding universal stress UspA family protein